MKKANVKYRITIVKDGPYIVSGNVPISEKVIVPVGNEYEYRLGRKLPQAQTYALCRCGRSKNPPFCDGAHTISDFRGVETASRKPYFERAEKQEGPGVDLYDDNRCAFARFCHRKDSTAWDLTDDSDTRENREEAIRAASECPAGRLTAVGKDGTVYEPEYEPEIEILQDPEREISAGIFVKGGIPIQSADGAQYETRNRVVLCRCGASRNKPFCDAAHVVIGYLDKQKQ